MQQISHKQSLYRIFFAIILLLSTLPIFSQGVGQYPVQVSTVVLPNPPMYLSAYSGVETDKLSVTLLNRDTQQSSLQVKLRMRIYCSQGQEISSRAESLYTPITLEGGIPLRLSMSDLAAYFRTENLRIAGSLPQGKLPVGHTRFCFEVLEYYTGRLLSSQGCGSAFIVLQTPPLLQQPSHGSLLTDDPTGGILFRWSPQHSVGLERVQYEFILKEMFDTQQSAELGFAHGVEVYRTHTTATSLLYGMMQPPLIAGKRYVWQVRAFTDPISGTPLAFENNGQSRVFTFDIDYPCQAPQHIIATAHTNGIHLTWDASPHPSANYHLSYRRKDFSSTWHQAVTTSNSYTISNLTPGANYEYKVGISCTNKTNDIHYSTVAHIAYNPDDSETPSTSIQTKVKECGKSTPNNISNTEPKETLWAGDVIYAGDFTITLSTVQGSNGRFTGEGKVHVPYLSGIGMSVYFSDISINTDNQLIEGKIHTVYDESRGTIMNLDAFDHGGTTTPAQGVLVPSYEFDFALTDVTRIHYDPLTNSLIFYDATGSRVGNYELTGTAPSFPVLVSDKEGNMYSINETNKDNPPANYTLVAVGKQIGELAGNAFDRNVVDSHKGTVTFFDAGVGTYSFDEFLPPYDNINYIRYSSENGNERLYPQLGANYYVPWKFIPLNTHDKVQAKISLAPNSELQPERVVFITESGTQVPASYNASNRTYQVSVTGTSNSGVHTLYALYPKGDGTSYFHLGQLRIDSRPPQHLKLVLVYAGGKYDKTAVANELNTIYNRVGIHWQVSEVQNFTYDKETIKTLFDKKSGLLSAYNDRMTSLNQALQSHLGDSYQSDACYVFMADASQAGNDRDVVGFMPRGRQYGYIYTKDLNASKIGSILAHELAHGKFKLYHTFDNIYAGKLAQGSTTNLMDYSRGTHLAKWQWNQLYDPAILNGVFDRDEDGEWVQLAQCATGAVLDFAMYYSVTWISMFFDDTIDQVPPFYDFSAVSNYKEFSWKEAGISAGISCASSVLPAFSSTKNARAFAVGLAAFGGAAAGMATEFGKQYDVAVDKLKKQNKEANFGNVFPKISWDTIFVTAGVSGAITAASTLIATSPKYAVLLAKMKTKLGATNSNFKSKLTKFVEGRLAKSGGAVAGSWSSIIGRNINDLATAPAGYQFYHREGKKWIRRIDASNPNTPPLTVKDGKIVELSLRGVSQGLINLSRKLGEVTNRFTASSRYTKQAGSVWDAPCLPDAEVLEVVVTKKTRVVRYFDIEPGVDNPGFRYSEFSGSWATVESEVAGLTPRQIKSKLALRDTPKYRVDVLLEPGDVVYISVAGPQSNFKELGGGLQIELPRWTLPSEKAKRFPNSTIIKL